MACQICRHAEKERIEVAILGGEPWPVMVSKWGLYPMAYSRHAAKCMGMGVRRLVRAQARKGELGAEPKVVDKDPSGRRVADLAEQAMKMPKSLPDPREIGEMKESMEGYRLLLQSRNYLLAVIKDKKYLRDEDHPDGLLAQDYINWEKVRVTAIRELRGVVLTALRVYEAQRILAMREKEGRPWESTVIFKFLEEKHPAVLQELLAYMAEVPE